MAPNEDTRGRIDQTRRTVLKAISLAGVTAIGSGTAVAASGEQTDNTRSTGHSGRAFPDVIPLPVGFQPEGIVTGRGDTFFVGSLANGAIYRGDLRTGDGQVLVEGTEAQVAVGLSYDRRSNYLFVAGDGTGQAYVYDAKTGESIETYDLTQPGSFVNDVVVTRNAAYFTDSARPFLYRVPLGPGGRLPEHRAVEGLPLGDEFEFVDGAFNANGIDAPPNGEYLVVVNTTTGLLYRVDPTSGEVTEIDLEGDTVPNGDGILLDGTTLYVVRNRANLIAVVELDREATEGEVVNTITDSAFDVPTTVAEFGNSLYAVNARFGTANPERAEYDVVRVSK